MAIYELIKNAVDAGSHRIEIEAQIVVPHSVYATAMEALDDGARTRAVLETLRGEILPGVQLPLATKFLSPLEKAAGRPKMFREALRASYRRHNWLEVRDTGHGMSLKELDEVFLTVGTRSRRAANVAGSQYLGDKGVGRLSAMRLGDHLTVTTSRPGESRWNVLKIDWGLFTHETQLEVGEINVAPKLGTPKEDPAKHGTVIRIAQLNGDWNTVRFEDVLQGRIARMVDPFEPGRANRLLSVRHNGNCISIPSIAPGLLAAAHATCSAKLTFEGDEPVLSGTIDYRLRQKKRVVSQRGAEIYSIAQNVWRRRGKRGHAATVVASIRPKALKELGAFEVDIYWYNRRIVEAVEGLTEFNRRHARRNRPLVRRSYALSSWLPNTPLRRPKRRLGRTR